MSVKLILKYLNALWYNSFCFQNGLKFIFQLTYTSLY